MCWHLFAVYTRWNMGYVKELSYVSTFECINESQESNRRDTSSCAFCFSLSLCVAGTVLCSLLWRCERIQQHLSSYLESIPIPSSIFSCPYRFITTHIIQYRRTNLTGNVRSHILYFSHRWLDIYIIQILA